MNSEVSDFNRASLLNITPYITFEGAEKLKQYKYCGGDTGLLYRLFYNPVATKLVTFLPDTLA